MALDKPRYYARDLGDSSAKLFWLDDCLHCVPSQARAKVVGDIVTSGVLDNLVRDAACFFVNGPGGLHE